MKEKYWCQSKGIYVPLRKQPLLTKKMIIRIIVPTYMVAYLYYFVWYAASTPKTFGWYVWQTLLIIMILIPTLILPDMVLAKKDKNLRR